MVAGWVKLYLGKDDEAVAWLRRAIESNRNFPFSLFFLAAALAHLGRLPEARSEAQSGLAIDPTFAIARRRASNLGDNPAVVAGQRRFIDGLRKAGVPEG
jgi:tetratricopeptide (TPR) repeat protein